MKLLRLTIHNIASIADATVDFAAEPLSSSEVFLITGRTGAGKSTILDSICLALYATTPRMKNTDMEGGVRDGDTELNVSDTRQLMRRNTAEAWVKLRFEGSDGVNYEAEWSVARARRKPGGKIQARQWTLTDLGSGTILSRARDIKEQIEKAIGLDFAQFCRTTMLAQGEFTKFLNSNDEEKAGILEKITGVDIYSRIGAKIYETTSARKADYEEAARLTAGITVMTDEEIAAKDRELNSLRQDLTATVASRKKVVDSLNAMDAYLKAEAEFAAAADGYAKALAIIESDDFRRTQQTIEQWHATADARKAIADMTAARDECSALETGLDNARATFTVLCEVNSIMERHLSELRKNRDITIRFINGEAPRKELYDNRQTIVSRLETRLAATRRLGEATGSAAAIETDIRESIGPKLQTARQNADMAAENVNRTKTALLTAEQNLADMEPDRLKARKAASEKLLLAVTVADERLKALTDERRRSELRRKNLTELNATIAANRQRLAACRPQLHDAEIRRDTAREIYDGMRESVSDWAKSIRSKLRRGDVCPVCRHTVESPVPTDDEITAIFLRAESALRDAEAECDNIRKTIDKLNADINADTRRAETELRELAGDTTLARREAEAAEACRECGIDCQAATARQELITLKTKLTESAAEISAAIILAEKAEKEVKVRQSEAAKASDDAATAQNTLARLTALADNRRTELRAVEATISEKRTDIARLDSELDNLTNAYGDSSWLTTPEAFIAKLNESADRYLMAQQTLTETDRQITELSATVTNAENQATAVGKFFPEDRRPVKPMPEPTDIPADILQQWNELHARTQSLADRRLVAAAKEKAAADFLDKFLTDNPSVNRDRINELAAIDARTIDSAITWQQHARDTAAAKQSAMLVIERQKKELEHARPNPTADYTRESLVESIARLETRAEEITRLTGAITHEIRLDADNRRTQQQRLEETAARKAVYEKWARLNRIFGSNDGKVFRKIAQSYVLGNLIHAANHYMHSLSDRYELAVEPGTFVITMRDAYQGAVRAASTLSGGESFLVSLALALSLSDIGRHISADTLFIDEGFGSLSGEPLHSAIETLRSLHARDGRRVGIISHVEELREQIPVQIRVDQAPGSATSEIRIVTV